MIKPTARFVSCLVLCLFVLASFTAFTPASAQEGQLDPIDQRIYLPLVSQQTASSDAEAAGAYTGRITYLNVPVVGQTLKIYHFDGVSWTVYATVVTDASGNYSFPGVPPLQWETRYFVAWENPAANPNWLSAWVCDQIDIYTYRTASFTCSFDIENVHLLAPGPADTYRLPITFRWQMRSSQFGEDYELNIADITDFDPWWSSAPYREPVDWYRMFTQPENLLTNHWYAWFVHVHGLNGYGQSFYYRPMIFTRIGTNTGPEERLAIPMQQTPAGK